MSLFVHEGELDYFSKKQNQKKMKQSILSIPMLGLNSYNFN